MHRGTATFTLDHGHCPPWLFERMVKLGRAMSEAIVLEFGPEEFVARLGDPVWFQSLGTVLAFDWNASGLTTILTAALKEAIRYREQELGIFIAGGKGKTSRKTPSQIQAWGGKLGLPTAQVNNLEYNSRMSAKVDSALIQDGYELYHHSFFFAKNGAWTVVQQGMNQNNKTARRYHWHSANVNDLIVEPHSGIASQLKPRRSLNLTAKGSEANRKLSLDMLASGYSRLLKDLELVDKYFTRNSLMMSYKKNNDKLTFLQLAGHEFNTHPVRIENYRNSKYLQRILQQLSEQKLSSYEEFVSRPGVGAKTVRALALVGEVLYGAKPSYRDPARYSFAHGGKDATPYPVDRETYDQTIQTIAELVRKSKMEARAKDQVLARLKA